MFRKLIATAIGAALLFAVVACGDDSDDEAASEPATATSGADIPTSEEFVDEANTTLCAPLIAAREDLAAEAGLLELTGPPTVEQLQGFYAAFLPEFTQFVEDFAALDPAPEDQAAFDAAVTELENAADVLTEAASDPAVTQEMIATDEAALHETDEAFATLGINPEC